MVGCCCVQAVEEVSVPIHRGPNVGVPETRLYHLGVFSIGDQHGGVCMAKVVKPKRLADRSVHGRKPATSHTLL